MLQSADDAPRVLTEGRSLLGHGWKAINSFDDLTDPEEFSDSEEELYVTLDLGSAIDNRVLQSETQYQLIGLDTPLPFLKYANQIFQGESTPLIGDEVILGLTRNQENPHNPSRPPIHSTHQRLTFRPVTLQPLDETSATKEKGSETKKAKEKTEEPRSIFMLRPATKGPNKPTETIRSEDLLKTRALERTSPTKHGDSAGTSDKEMPEPELAAGSSRLPEIFDQPVKRSHKKKSSQTLKPQVTRKPRAPRKAASPSAETETQAIAGPSGATLITHDPDAPVKRKGRPKSLFPKPKLVIDNPAELDDLDLDGLAGTTRIEITQEAQISLGFASPHSAVELEKRQFTKAEILRLRAGRPLHGPGSRGGRMGGERVFRDRRTSVRKEIQGGLVFITGGEEGDGEVRSQADDGNDQEDEGDGDEEEEREGGDDESAELDEPGL